MRHLQLYNNCPHHHTEWTKALKIYILPDYTHGMVKKIGCQISKYYHDIFWYGDGLQLASGYGVYCTLKVQCARQAQLSCQLCNYNKLNVLKELRAWHPFIKWISKLVAPYFLKQHPVQLKYISNYLACKFHWLVTKLINGCHLPKYYCIYIDSNLLNIALLTCAIYFLILDKLK